jgi:hypothetical protein
MRLVLASVFCALALSGFGVTPATAADPASVEAFKLAYQRSGGVAASTQTLAVRSGRHATATSSGTSAGRTRSEFPLTGRRIRSLQRSLSRADLDSIPPPGPGGCADCYVYDLKYEGHHLELEEVDVPPRLRAVFDTLDAMIATHVAAPTARG